ncbi:MAG: hypothetical protein QOK16_3271 [Solirubrobacteraceae bacterium]|nr:hypothetical protein [Solirubrobacteraceae bacterium]
MRRALAIGLLALAIGLAAALFDAEPLWVPAVTLLVLAGAAATWVALASSGVQVQRTLAARRVMEDEPVSIVLTIRAGRIALPPARLVDPLLPDAAPVRAGRRGARIRIEARFSRRGRRRLALPRLLICDPLGLATRAVVAVPSPASDELLVLPRIEPITRAGGGAEATRIARRGRPAMGAEVEIDGIRPLRDGTPASRIFWPAVARGADPQERYLAVGNESQPLVVLDPRGAATEDQLDAAVRATASLARALATSGGCGVLLPGDRRPTELSERLAGWAALHARLALIGPLHGPALACIGQRSGPIIFVSARMRTRLPPAVGPGQGAARVLVIPGRLSSMHAAFAVGGCSGYVLGGRRSRARPGESSHPAARRRTPT